MKKSTPEAIKEVQKELLDWESELRRLQELAVLAASRTNLQTVEIPALVKQVKAKEAEIPGLTAEAEEARTSYPCLGPAVLIIWFTGAVRPQHSSRK